MKKLILLGTFALFFTFTVTANTIKEKTTKKEVIEMPKKTNIEDIEYPKGVWIVTEVSPYEIHCDRGGKSDCPVSWFLK